MFFIPAGRLGKVALITLTALWGLVCSPPGGFLKRYVLGVSQCNSVRCQSAASVAAPMANAKMLRLRTMEAVNILIVIIDLLLSSAATCSDGAQPRHANEKQLYYSFYPYYTSALSVRAVPGSLDC